MPPREISVIYKLHATTWNLKITFLTFFQFLIYSSEWVLVAKDDYFRNIFYCNRSFTHHIHDLHEAEAKVNREALRVVENRSLQRVVPGHQTTVQFALRWTLLRNCRRKEQIVNQNSLNYRCSLGSQAVFLFKQVSNLLSIKSIFPY